MSDTELNKKEASRDKLDGGFAVVDRERLIEEETREITPWYKHFIHAFTAPEQMMEECFNADPPKGASVGVVGCILFSLIFILLCFANSAYTQPILDQLRAQGITETNLDMSFQITMISGSIGAVIGIFISCLFATIILVIIKAILRDKGKFGAFFKVLLVGNMVMYAIHCVDAVICIALGQFTTIFSLAPLLGVDMMSGSPLSVIASTVSLENIVFLVLIAIGYKVVTRTNYKKAALAVIIYEVITVAYSVGMASLMASLTQSLMGA